MEIDKQVIRDCLKGERRAEYQLYKASFSYLMSICIRYTRNSDKAKEVLNMGFLKIIKGLNKYDPEVPFKPWARKIMVNTLINEYKKEKAHYKHNLYVEEYYDNYDYSELNGALDRINADQIYRMISDLPPASQQVFNLYFIDGYKHKEIGEMMGISEGTSKWHLNAARQKLKEMISQVEIPARVIVNE